MTRKMPLLASELTELEQIPNIGPAIASDLRRIGVHTPADLEEQDPFALYEQLCEHDAQRIDPCVLDVFMAATDFVSGKPSQPWWKYTAKRKRELARREMAKDGRAVQRLGRRSLLVNGALLLLASKPIKAAAMMVARSPDERKTVRFSMLTDLHYADKPPGGTRFYRETLTKLDVVRENLTAFQPQFVVELGDVIDAAESVEQETQYLKTVSRKLAELPGDNHYVIGNHCVYSLTKNEFLAVVQQDKSYYSFDAGDLHLIVLDGCFRSDGVPYGRKNYQWTDANIPPEEMEWLASDLNKTQRPTIVFIHQRLDTKGDHAVKNAAQVRKLFEKSGNVLAVFQGHYHRNDYREIGGIHYCTLRALVEGSGKRNNAFANVRVEPNGTIRLEGLFEQESYQWS